MGNQPTEKRRIEFSNPFEGAFAETAFSEEEIDRTIHAEKRIGLDKLLCAFLSGLDTPEINS